MNKYFYSLAYLPVFFILLFLSLPLDSKNKSYLYSFYRKYFAIFVLIVFIAFRSYIYADWIGYRQLYLNAPKLYDGFEIISRFINEGLEKGFLLFIIICKTISEEYLFFQTISSIIDLIILYIFFNQHIQENIVLGFIAFYVWGLYLEIDLLRNVKSVMIFILSIKYIKDKKVVCYIVLNILAMTFHISSVFYFPIYYIARIKYNRTVILILWIIGNFIFLLSWRWLNPIINFIMSLSYSRITYLMERYTSSKVYSTAYGISIGYLERQLTFIIFYIFQDKILKKNKDNVVFINLLYIYSFIFLYLSEMSIFVIRIPQLFICSYWILYPKLYETLRGKKYIFLSLFIVFSIFKILYTNSMPERRYENILFPHDSPERRAYIYQHK